MIFSTFRSRLTRKRPSACLNNPDKKARPGSPFHSLADEQEYTAKMLLATHARPTVLKKWSPAYLVKNHTLTELSQMVDIARTGPKPLKVAVESQSYVD